MGMGEAALLAWFGSELADDRLLILAVLKDAGRLTVEEISRRLALDAAAVEHWLRTLVLAELVTAVEPGAAYQADGPNFPDLVAGLRDADPAPRRS